MKQKQKRQILILEDSSVIALELQMKLEEFGYEVSGVFTNGEKVIEEVRINPPELILADIKLAGNLDGIQTITQIHKEQYIPVIYITGHADDKKIERAKETKPLAYLLKPYEDNYLEIALTMAFSKIDVDRELENYKNTLEDIVEQRTQELRRQKELLQRRNKDLTDSIDYALNIQKALLPDLEDIRLTFPQSFVLFKPKDVLSGDFYWFYRQENSVTFAVGDCTGHGVPGALLSIIGHNYLNEIIIQQNTRKPKEILEQLNRNLCKTFEKTSKKYEMSDGIDIALCSLDLKYKKLSFAGAYRPMYVYGKGHNSAYKGDRKSIGGLTSDANAKFTQYDFTIQSGSVIYLFSDGYSDQLGGKPRQKFRLKRLENCFEKIHKLELNAQHDFLDKQFNEWVEGHDQVDDVLILGIKIP